MFKVRCKLVSFAGYEELFPCHFNYKIGDEFYYDGVYFSGRICPGLLANMMPIIHGVFHMGNKYFEHNIIRYRGPDTRDESMARYDGAGFRPREGPPEGVPEKLAKLTPNVPRNERPKAGHVVCGDTRILADFACEAVQA